MSKTKDTRPLKLADGTDNRPGLGRLEAVRQELAQRQAEREEFYAERERVLAAAKEKRDLARAEFEAQRDEALARAKQKREASEENKRKEFRTKQVQLAVDSIDWDRVHSPISRLAILAFAVFYREATKAQLDGVSREKFVAEKAYEAVADLLAVLEDRPSIKQARMAELLSVLQMINYLRVNVLWGMPTKPLKPDSNDLTAQSLSQFDWGLRLIKVAIQKNYEAAQQ